MKIKQITFILENCDSITIDGKYVGDFLVDNIHTSIGRIACNSIEKIDIANTFVIEIHKDANKKRFEFDNIQNEDSSQMVFDRLEYKDIVGIQFELEEPQYADRKTPYVEHYNYYVDWVGDSEYSNEAQSNYISECGNLYIIIAKNKDIEDFFNLEEINDDNSINFRFSIYNIGDSPII